MTINHKHDLLFITHKIAPCVIIKVKKNLNCLKGELEKHDAEWTGQAEIKMAKCLAVYKACKAIF